MNIRPARESDYIQVMELYNDFVGSDRYSNNDNDSFRIVLHSNKEFIFIAEEGDNIVGFVTFSIRSVVRYPKPIAELDELFVIPEMRKKGLGRTFMEIVENTAKKHDCYRLFIESHYDHKTAHIFYESLGYSNYGYHFIKNL